MQRTFTGRLDRRRFAALGSGGGGGLERPRAAAKRSAAHLPSHNN